MKKILFIPIVIIFLASSCNETIPEFGETKVAGLVHEESAPVTTPIANALVELVWVEHFTINTVYHHIDSVRTDANGHYSFTATTPNEDLMVWVPDADTYFPTLDKDSHHRNVEFGTTNHRNLYITPISWVRINYDQLDVSHGIGINRIAGTERVDGYILVSDTVVTSRIWGNAQADLSVFYFEGTDQVNHEDVLVPSGSNDTTDVNISF